MVSLAWSSGGSLISMGLHWLLSRATWGRSRQRHMRTWKDIAKGLGISSRVYLSLLTQFSWTATPHGLNIFYLHSPLRRAKKPNPVMIVPEIMLIHGHFRVVNLPRNRPIPLLRMNHHRAEPRKTPRTKIPAEK